MKKLLLATAATVAIGAPMVAVAQAPRRTGRYAGAHRHREHGDRQRLPVPRHLADLRRRLLRRRAGDPGRLRLRAQAASISATGTPTSSGNQYQRRQLEMDFYGGWKGTWGDFGFDIGTSTTLPGERSCGRAEGTPLKSRERRVLHRRQLEMVSASGTTAPTTSARSARARRSAIPSSTPRARVPRPERQLRARQRLRGAGALRLPEDQEASTAFAAGPGVQGHDNHLGLQARRDLRPRAAGFSAPRSSARATRASSAPPSPASPRTRQDQARRSACRRRSEGARTFRGSGRTGRHVRGRVSPRTS